MTTQINDEDFHLMEDRIYRALILSLAVAKHLGVHSESALKKFGPKCGWIHFSIVKNFLNRGSKIDRDFWKEVNGSDEVIFGTEEVRNFIHSNVNGIDGPGGGDGKFIIALHDKVVDFLSIQALSGQAREWMQAGLNGFDQDMRSKEVLKLK